MFKIPGRPGPFENWWDMAVYNFLNIYSVISLSWPAAPSKSKPRSIKQKIMSCVMN